MGTITIVFHSWSLHVQESLDLIIELGGLFVNDNTVSTLFNGFIYNTCA